MAFSESEILRLRTMAQQQGMDQGMIERTFPMPGSQAIGAAATERLRMLANDPAWGAKLTAGDAGAMQEFHQLTAAKVLQEHADAKAEHDRALSLAQTFKP